MWKLVLALVCFVFGLIDVARIIAGDVDAIFGTTYMLPIFSLFYFYIAYTLINKYADA